MSIPLFHQGSSLAYILHYLFMTGNIEYLLLLILRKCFCVYIIAKYRDFVNNSHSTCRCQKHRMLYNNNSNNNIIIIRPMKHQHLNFT